MSEIIRTIEVLEALIVTVLLNEMEFEMEKVKEIMLRDERYWYLIKRDK